VFWVVYVSSECMVLKWRAAALIAVSDSRLDPRESEHKQLIVAVARLEGRL